LKGNQKNQYKILKLDKMSWVITTFTSSIGKKIVMGATGLFLCSFLVVHCGINALVFNDILNNDDGALFEAAAHFMGTNWVIRTMEIGLFAGIFLHIIQAAILTYQNKKSRPVGYAVTNGNANSKWYSRSMGLLGTLILFFMIIHIRHFWVETRLLGHIGHEPGQETMFDEMKEIFENPVWVSLYVLSMISLAYHLMHGFQAGFQTLGINHPKYTPFIKGLGKVFSIVIPFIFALMPLAFYFKFIQ
jgi:succinate dehydrogenase / fumarate reductase cytochrome b subunit